MSEIINEKPTGAVAVSAVEVPSSAPRNTIGQLLRGDLGFLPVLLTLIVIVAIFAFSTNGIFLEPRNLSNLMNQVSYIGVLALGSTMVLLLGEIDLSVAVVGSLCAVVMAIFSERMGYPGSIAIILGIVAGAIVGFINGIFVAVLRVPSFIVTLAGSIGYSGLLLFLLAGQSTLIISNPLIDAIAGTSTSFLTNVQGIGLPTIALLLYIASLIFVYVNRRRNGLKGSSLLSLIGRIVFVAVLVEGAVVLFESYNGVPYTAAIVFGLIAIFWILLTKTSFGRHMYAVGGNAEAARRAGINVIYIRIMAFTLCSALAAVGGIILASRSLSVQSQVPATLLLDAIAAAVIGGVSLFGGRGSVWSIVLGMLIIGSLENGLDLKSQPVEVKEMIEGAVLLLAVTVDAVLRRIQARSASGR
ncbi:MAG TPA: inner-membrane translocator [Ktedonobacteraceae bacterium]|nr:inner-membrane translocator [Ktedonobacteraceae bacterium]